jgi:hypothetical protein
LDITKKEFDKVNERRHELIDKQHSGFTEEESVRNFKEHPGWEEECERRYHANLTDEEREELAECQNIVMEYRKKHAPLMTPETEEYLNNLLEEMKNEKAKKEGRGSD